LITPLRAEASARRAYDPMLRQYCRDNASHAMLLPLMHTLFAAISRSDTFSLAIFDTFILHFRRCCHAMPVFAIISLLLLQLPLP
jgi:hypothetical protein